MAFRGITDHESGAADQTPQRGRRRPENAMPSALPVPVLWPQPQVQIRGCPWGQGQPLLWGQRGPGGLADGASPPGHRPRHVR